MPPCIPCICERCANSLRPLMTAQSCTCIACRLMLPSTAGLAGCVKVQNTCQQRGGEGRAAEGQWTHQGHLQSALQQAAQPHLPSPPGWQSHPGGRPRPPGPAARPAGGSAGSCHAPIRPSLSARISICERQDGFALCLLPPSSGSSATQVLLHLPCIPAQNGPSCCS